MVRLISLKPLDLVLNLPIAPSEETKLKTNSAGLTVGNPDAEAIEFAALFRRFEHEYGHAYVRLAERSGRTIPRSPSAAGEPRSKTSESERMHLAATRASMPALTITAWLRMS